MVAAVIGVLVLGGLAGSLVGRGSPGGLSVETVAGPEAADPTPAHGEPTPEAAATPEVPPVTIGEWRAQPAAPVDVPLAHDGAWTGSELIVFGDGGEPTAFDPHAREWRTLPPPPGPLPEIGTAVWTGEELLVWRAGGVAAEIHLDGGLAYRSGADRWREVAAPPEDARAMGAAVWTGREVVLVGPNGAVAYSPAEDTWRRLARPRRAAVARAAGAWTGREVLVWGGRDQDDGGLGRRWPAFAEAYDPARDTWRRLPPPLLSDSASAPAVWTGDELVMWGRPVAGGGVEAPPTGAVLDPAEARWRLLPLAPGMRAPGAAARVYGHTAVWTGRQVIFHGGYPRAAGLALDPPRREWTVLPRRPASVHHVAAWTGESMLVWGGSGRRGPTVQLVEWRPHGPARPPL